MSMITWIILEGLKGKKEKSFFSLYRSSCCASGNYSSVC